MRFVASLRHAGVLLVRFRLAPQTRASAILTLFVAFKAKWLFYILIKFGLELAYDDNGFLGKK
jgi:hypothetical protein